LNGFASDINQNGLPEFTVIGRYCPISCTHPDTRYDFFEIRNTHSVVDLTGNLPGQLSPRNLYSTDPPIFNVWESRGYDLYLNIWLQWLYKWDGAKFANVTREHTDLYTASAEEQIEELKSHYGGPFEYYDRAVLRILLTYEMAGMRAKALQTFLDLTDISHWPGTSPKFQCWLAISRATILEDYANDRPFSLPPSTMFFEENMGRYLQPFDQQKYDFSACNSFIKK
jgi:hypothetical protein